MAAKIYQIIQGDSAEKLKNIPSDTIDAVVTDPPYGIAFLGKDWDSFKATKVAKSQVVKNLGTGMRMTTHDENKNYQEWCQQWGEQCLRILKPGGFLLAFSAARLYHRIATGLEDAGFEIRDQLMWIYSSGFPKAQDMGKNLHKRQTNTRSYTIPPADIAKLTRVAGDLYQHPDNYMVRRLPNTKGSGAADQYGGGKWQDTYERVAEIDNQWRGWKTALKPAHEPIVMARKPFKGSTIDNIQRWGVGALNIDATRIPFEANPQGRYPSNVLGDIPEYQKYFYCPKVTRKERHCGYDTAGKGNNHPTVKPVALMRYLIQLVAPANSHIVDPFTGSGTTGMAAVELGHRFTGIEKDPHYVEIANKRIQGWSSKEQDTKKSK